MLAAVLTVSGPWLPARWRRWWWALLLAFVPIHLVVSAVVPARSLLGPRGRLVRRRADGARRRNPGAGGAARRCRAGAGPPRIRRDRADGGAARRARDRWCCGRRRTTPTDDGRSRAIVEMYGPNQRSGGIMSQVWRRAAVAQQRDRSAARLDAPRRRAPRPDGDRHRRPRRGQQHDDRGGRARPRLDAVRPHPDARHGARRDLRRRVPRRAGLEGARASCTATRSPTATCAARRSPSTTAPRCSAASAAPSTARPTCSCRPTSPQLLVTTTAIFGAEAAVRAAIDGVRQGHRPRAPPAG